MKAINYNILDYFNQVLKLTTDTEGMVDEVAHKPHFAENFLFLILGAVCSVMVSLGTFGAVDNRAPASIESVVTDDSGFDSRIFFYR